MKLDEGFQNIIPGIQYRRDIMIDEIPDVRANDTIVYYNNADTNLATPYDS